MNQQDFENQNKWGAPMDTDAHLKSYKGFLWISVVSGAVCALILIFMAVFLT